MSGELICPHCGAGVKPAMLKCYDCGERLKGGRPTVTAGSSTAVAAASSSASAGPAASAAARPRRAGGPVIVGASGPMRVRDYSRSAPSRIPDRQQIPASPAARQPADVPTKSTPPEPQATEVPEPQSPPERPAAAVTHSAVDSAAAADAVLVEVCACGNRMRVPAAWAGQKKKCRRCGAEVIPGSGASSAQAPVNRCRAASDDDIRQMRETLISEIEARPGPSSLTRTVSSRVLKKLEQRLQVTDPLDGEEAFLRRAAVLELGTTGDIRAIALLQSAVQDSSAAVRQGVATAAGSLSDPAAALLPLMLLQDSSPDVVRDAIAALRETAEPRVVPLLLKVGLQDGASRLHVREAIVGLGDLAIPALLTAMQSIDASVIPDAVIAAGRIGNPQAVPALLNVLDRTSGPARLAAVDALGQIGDDRAIGPLVQLLQEADESLQIRTAAALIRCPDSRCVRPLTAILQRTQNTELRKTAARALAATRDPRGVPAIVRLLDVADDALRELAAEALGAIGDRTACSALVGLLRSGNAALVLKAMTALRKVATAEAVPALIPLVQHANPSIRRHAVEILGDLRPDDAFDLFAELLEHDSSFEVRAAAARGLGKLKDQHAIRLLEQALRDESAVRCAAVIGLTAIGDPAVIPALLASLKDVAPVVRYHAVTGLGRLQAEQAATAVRRLLEDKDAMVRTGAEKTLAALGIAKPKVPLKRRLTATAGRLLPDSVVGIVPGGVVTIVAGCCLIAVAAFGWQLLQNSKPNQELQLAQALFSTADVTDVLWAGSSDRVAVLRTDGSVDLWNATTGEFDERQKLDRPAVLATTASADPSARIAFTPGGKSQIGRWATAAGPEAFARMKWAPFDGRILSATAAGDGSVLLAVTGPSTSVVWNVNEQTAGATLAFRNHPRPALSSDGHLAVGIVLQMPEASQTGKAKAILSLYATESGDLLSELQPDALPNVQSLCFSPDGQRLFVTTSAGLVSLAVTDKGFGTASEPVSIPPFRSLRSGPGPESRLIGAQGTSVAILDASTGKATTLRVAVAPGMKAPDCQHAVMSADGSRVLVAGEDSKSAWVIDVASGESRELSPLQIPEHIRQPQ